MNNNTIFPKLELGIKNPFTHACFIGHNKNINSFNWYRLNYSDILNWNYKNFSGKISPYLILNFSSIPNIFYLITNSFISINKSILEDIVETFSFIMNSPDISAIPYVNIYQLTIPKKILPDKLTIRNLTKKNITKLYAIIYKEEKNLSKELINQLLSNLTIYKNLIDISIFFQPLSPEMICKYKNCDNKHEYISINYNNRQNSNSKYILTKHSFKCNNLLNEYKENTLEIKNLFLNFKIDPILMLHSLSMTIVKHVQNCDVYFNNSLLKFNCIDNIRIDLTNFIDMIIERIPCTDHCLFTVDSHYFFLLTYYFYSENQEMYVKMFNLYEKYKKLGKYICKILESKKFYDGGVLNYNKNNKIIENILKEDPEKNIEIDNIIKTKYKSKKINHIDNTIRNCEYIVPGIYNINDVKLIILAALDLYIKIKNIQIGDINNIL